jgi:hypothetical protein
VKGCPRPLPGMGVSMLFIKRIKGLYVLSGFREEDIISIPRNSRPDIKIVRAIWLPFFVISIKNPAKRIRGENWVMEGKAISWGRKVDPSSAPDNGEPHISYVKY